MEHGKGDRFPFHTILNHLEQVKSCGVPLHDENFVLNLAVKDCLRNGKMGPASWASLNSTQPTTGGADRHLMNPASC